MFYVFGRALFRTIIRTLFRWRIEGKDNIPKEGPLILCCNHFSWWDPFHLGSAVDRPVRFMAKEEWFKIPVMGSIARGWGAFPVKRHTADRASLRHALKVLEEGGVFGIFPEGTRSRTRQLMKPESGTAWIAIKARAPVVPAAIVGNYSWFKPLVMRIGKPIDLAAMYPGRTTSEDLEKASQTIMNAIAALLEQGMPGPERGNSAKPTDAATD